MRQCRGAAVDEQEWGRGSLGRQTCTCQAAAGKEQTTESDRAVCWTIVRSLTMRIECEENENENEHLIR